MGLLARPAANRQAGKSAADIPASAREAELAVVPDQPHWPVRRINWQAQLGQWRGPGAVPACGRLFSEGACGRP